MEYIGCFIIIFEPIEFKTISAGDICTNKSYSIKSFKDLGSI